LKIAIILNGISRKKKHFFQRILPVLQEKHAVTLFETLYAGHARELAYQIGQEKFEVIFSAGGDGTLNQVINGIADSGLTNSPPRLGLIPLGSGNDFAGTIGVTDDATQMIQLLKDNVPKPTDLGIISCRNHQGQHITRYFLNACSLGMGPVTVRQMEKMPLWMSPDLRYLYSIIKTFLTHKTHHIEFKTDSWTWEGKVRVLAIANGKSFGNRIYIAPLAKQEDGVLDIFLASDVSLVKFLLYLQQIKSARQITDSRIQYAHTTRIEITSPESVAVEAEGELIGFLPAIIEVVPRRISMLRP
jgi:diacylglycerol kinase (ATP)